MFLTLRNEQRVMAFENRALLEPVSLTVPFTTVKIIRSQMSWEGNVADMGKMTNGNKMVVIKPERKDCVRLLLQWL